MKTIITILLFSLTLLACSDEALIKNETADKKLPTYTIVEIEGCEYFSFYSTHDYMHITHKGNCKNVIHCYNK